MSWISRTNALRIEFCERTGLTKSPSSLPKHVDVEVIENGYALQPVVHADPQLQTVRIELDFEVRNLGQ
jgi:hypothetical protein